MTAIDRAIWIAGLLAIAITVLYWPSIKAAYKNRQTIATATDILAGMGIT